LNASGRMTDGFNHRRRATGSRRFTPKRQIWTASLLVAFGPPEENCGTGRERGPRVAEWRIWFDGSLRGPDAIHRSPPDSHPPSMLLAVALFHSRPRDAECNFLASVRFLLGIAVPRRIEGTPEYVLGVLRQSPSNRRWQVLNRCVGHDSFPIAWDSRAKCPSKAGAPVVAAGYRLRYLCPERIGVRHSLEHGHIEWFDRAGPIDPNVLVELTGQNCLEIVTGQLAFRPIDHADRAL
jgi:hypothetical protein